MLQYIPSDSSKQILRTVISKMKLLVVFSCISFAYSRNYKPLKVYYNVTDTEYSNLPVLFHFDDFDTCMSQNPTLYCYTTIQLKPRDAKNISNTWRCIQELINTSRTYRHDKLRHGICLPVSYPQIPIKMYANGNGSDDLWMEISNYYSDKYHKLGLIAEVTKIHCRGGKSIYKVDYLDILYGAIILSLLLMIITGTFYDRTRRQVKNSYSLYENIFLAFSITRNWERLITESTSELSKTLKCFQGIRVYNTALVVLSHTVMLILMGPVQNPKFTENTTLNPATIVLSNGSLVCQTYFLMSAWLLSYHFFSIYENKKVTLRHLFYAFVQRYYRLAPTILFSVGFSATWLRHFGDGPFWHKYVDDEFKNCRKNWWLNILFLNNYVNSREMCLQQTWYIACEMQCFIVGLFVLMFAINKPKHTKRIFATVLLLGILISVGHNYYMDYDIVYRSYSETLYTLYLELEQWTDTFVAGHIAFPAYAEGLIFGYYFHKFKKVQNKITFKTNVYYSIWIFFTFLFGLGIIMIAFVFYQEGFECSRLEAAFYQGLCRSIFALAIGQLLFVIVFGGGGIMTPFVTWSPFQILARVTFGIYLTHVWVMRIRYGTQRSPAYATNLIIFNNYISDLIVALILGTLVCLCVEMPLSALDKVIFSSREKPSNEHKAK